MLRGCVLWVTLVAGCSPEVASAPRGASEAKEQAILCAYRLDEPQLSGVLPNHDNDGVDCVPPEGGDLFTLGFGWRDGLIQLTESRASGEWRIYARTKAGWCVDWLGEVAIEDLPAWSASFDVRCSDDSLRFAGRIDYGRL